MGANMLGEITNSTSNDTFRTVSANKKRILVQDNKH